MLRAQFLVGLVLFLQVVIAAGISANANDVELDAFKKAERQKRSASDIQDLIKCSYPLAEEDDGITEDQKAKKLGVCLARAAIRKEGEGKDSAADMVRRIQQLASDNKIRLSRRGWWGDAVKKVKGWFDKHGDTIKKGIKIAVDIVKAIWGKK